MKTRIWLGLLALVLIAGIMASGCAAPAPSTAPSTEPAAAPAAKPAATPVKPIEMKLALSSSPTTHNYTFYDTYVKEIEERTGGRLKIVIYPSETLGKMFDQWDMTSKGVCDICHLIPQMYKGVFPRCDVSDLPFVMPEDRDLNLLNTIYDEYIHQDFEGKVKVLWIGLLGGVELHTKDPVRTMEDLKGMQIRTPPGPISPSLTALGGIPVTIPASEVYTSLERGMVDGCTFPMEALDAYKLYEVTNYHTMISIMNGFVFAGMNLDAWNSLPPDIQKVLDELAPWAQQLFTDTYNHMDEVAIEKCKEGGAEIIYVTPEERARWMQTTQPVVDAWCAEMDGKGMEGTAIVKEVRQLAAGE